MTEQPNSDPAPAQSNFTQSTQYNDQTASNNTAPAEGGSASSSTSDSVDLKAFLSVRAILRYVTWFTALLAFAIMSDTWYRAHSSWRGIVAFGVLSWLFCMAAIAAYVLRPLYQAKFGKEALYAEVGADVFFVVFGFITSIVGAVKCNDNSWHAMAACFSETEAAIAFAFITTFLHAVGVFLSLFHLRSKN